MCAFFENASNFSQKEVDIVKKMKRISGDDIENETKRESWTEFKDFFQQWKPVRVQNIEQDMEFYRYNFLLTFWTYNIIV